MPPMKNVAPGEALNEINATLEYTVQLLYGSGMSVGYGVTKETECYSLDS